MDKPNKCPGKRDKRSYALTITHIGLSCSILWFLSFIWVLFFLAFQVTFNFIFLNLYLCRKCLYKLGSERTSVETYYKEHGAQFIRRMRIVFPLLMFNWFFPFVMGIITVIYNYFNNFSAIYLLIPLMIAQLLITLTIIKRTPKKYCKACLFRDYCPVAQNNRF